MNEEAPHVWTDDEIVAHAIGLHPDCSHGVVRNGCTIFLQLTRVVELWRNRECYEAGDPPRHVVEGYPMEESR